MDTKEIVLTTTLKTNVYDNDSLVNYLDYKLSSIGHTHCVSYEFDETDSLISYVFITHVKIPANFLNNE